MRVLLDTNIFISREADRVVSSDLADLLGIFNELRSELLVHPLSVTDLKILKNVLISPLNALQLLEDLYQNLVRR